MAQWITREEWNALPPKGSYRSLVSPVGTAIHWPGDGRWATKDPRVGMKHIQEIHYSHPTEDYIDIAYNLGVAPGVILEGRSVASAMNRRSGANGSATANTSHFAIVVLHGSGDGEPSDLLLRTVGEAVRALRDKAGAGSRVAGHRDFRATLCPGVFYPHLPLISQYASGEQPAPPPPPPPPPTKTRLYGRGVVWWDRLHYGSRNSDSVRNLQQRLIDTGYSIPAGVTGNYLSQTRQAVAAFQRKQGWSGSGADGMIHPGGRVTTSRLFIYPNTPYTVRWDKS